MFPAARVTRLKSEKLHTLHAKTAFPKVRACAGAARKTKKATQKPSQKSFPKRLKITVFLSFFALQAPVAKTPSKMTSRRAKKLQKEAPGEPK